MCGIVGYVGKRPVQDLLLAGLTRLEYRGYDSAGISVIAGDEIESVRAVGNLDHLREAVAHGADGDGGAVAVATRPATTGIGHTRWATHGRVNEENAHPHFDTTGSVHVVVNGIVENYMALKERLVDMGAVFTSETDAEVIAHLISHHLAAGDLVEAVRAAYAELDGHFAFVAMRRDEPEVLVGARKECPLVVGLGDDETFLASAIPAFLRETRRVQFIENGEIVAITPEGTTVPAARRHRARARDPGDRLGRRDRREGRLRDVHAQGDPRAGGRRRRDDRRPHAARRRRRPRRRRRARRGDPARRQARSSSSPAARATTRA